MKKLFTLSLAILAFQLVQAQESEIKPKTPIGGRPNIASDLNFEFGFNQLTNRPETIGVDFLGSRTFNISYQVPVYLFGKSSGFTLNPGLGIGSDKLSFKKNENLFNNPLLGSNSSKLMDVTDMYGDKIDLKVNKFAANYFEIPVDLRYHFNKSNYGKSFRVSVGGKIGFLYEAHTKIKYESPDFGKRKIKDSQQYGLEKIRYAVSVKAGSPGFYVWTNIYLNDMWEKGQGPYNTQASQVNFGVAVTVF
jgi:hypothetical protein